MTDTLEDIVCTPSRKPIKFFCSSYTRNCLSFDSVISREDRHLMFMEIFACANELVSSEVVPGFTPARYIPEELLELRVVSDHRHPAFGQLGLYAKKTIPSNTVVTSYAGVIEVFGSSCNSRTYTMGFGTIGDDFALDAEFAGNYGRFANDPRGVIGLSANLIAENRFNSRGESYTALVSRRQIVEGEEILMAYGKAHSLSSSPWTNVEGSLVVRHRLSGMMPFPHLQDPQMSYDIMWECSQCGMWSHGRDNRHQQSLCYRCQCPQASGTPLVALVSSPSITKGMLLKEAESGACTCGDSSETSSTLSSTNPTNYSILSSPSFYRSVKVDWPMNTPFLPWQIWDPTVPIATVLKHSRFESQEHLFLYNVTCALQSDDDNDNDDDDESEEEFDEEEISSVPTKNSRKRQRQEALWERQEHESISPRVFCEPVDQKDTTCEHLSSLTATNTKISLSPLDTSNQVPRLLVLVNGSKASLENTRSSLLKIRRRLYAGKKFNAGELVGYVGGVIRHASDTRCRPDNSPLTIPMRYFLPWRMVEHDAMKTRDKKEELSASDPLTQAKIDLVKRFSQLVFVVTNEMMYCPCLVLEEGSSDCDISLSSVLKQANVAFVLTVDSLGCPFVACYSTRRINAFDPLLARV